jgi:unsaturated rhamnogalacturonyl hydrolase
MEGDKKGMNQVDQWSVKMAQTIMMKRDGSGYHPELNERWAYVPGMALRALQWLGE